MFSAIVKGFKWFFAQPKDEATKLARKHRHASYNPATNTGPVKVRGIPEVEKGTTNTNSIVTACNKMMDIGNVSEVMVIEEGKTRIFMPMDFTDMHIEHALRCCGFQKSPSRGGNGMKYDPMVIQAIKLSINMYSSGVHTRLEEIEAKLDKALDK